MKSCTNAKKYKATRAPRCNKGNPCDECVRKWNERCNVCNETRFIVLAGGETSCYNCKK